MLSHVLFQQQYLSIIQGRLALSGGTLTSEFVEFEVKRALEWLQGSLSKLSSSADRW